MAAEITVSEIKALKAKPISALRSDAIKEIEAAKKAVSGAVDVPWYTSIVAGIAAISDVIQRLRFKTFIDTIEDAERQLKEGDSSPELPTKQRLYISALTLARRAKIGATEEGKESPGQVVSSEAEKAATQALEGAKEAAKEVGSAVGRAGSETLKIALVLGALYLFLNKKR